MTSASTAPERATLARTFKAHWVWAIALGSAVGWGAFVLPTDWMATAGPVGAILGILIGGALMCLIAVSYGMLIRTFPVSGGEYAYSFLSFGRIHAYICGWFLTLGYVAIVALNASAVALLFRRMVPPLVEWAPLWEVAGWQVYLGEVLVATAAIVGFAWLNTRGTTISGQLQFLFCLVMVGAVIFMFLGALFSPEGTWENATPAFPEGKAALPAILAIVAVAPWAYVGFDNVPQAAEEFDFSPARAFRLIIFAIVAAAGIYSLMILATAMAVDWSDLVASGPVWGTADGMEQLFGAIGLVLLAVAVAMGVFTGLNGFYVSASRLLFAMGRAHTLPRGFAQLSAKGTPSFAIWFVAGVTLVAPWFGREALLWVVDMSAVGVTIAYTYTCLAAFRLFRWSSSQTRPGDPEGVRSTTRKLLSGLGALAGIGFFLLLMTPGSPAQLGTPSLTALAVWVVLGVVFFLLRRGPSGLVSDEEMRYLITGDEAADKASTRN